MSSLSGGLANIIDADMTPLLVGGLPSAGSVAKGATRYCTNLLLPTALGICAGGGAVGGIVFSDQTNWRCL